MENTISSSPEPGFFERNRTLIKGFLTGFLILLMLIPQAFITELVYERRGRQQEVVNEVSSKWATAQTINGPVLVIPYKQTEQSSDGKKYEIKKFAYFLPDDLQINGKVDPEVRHRSLYQVTLYRSLINIQGKFKALSLQHLQLLPEQMIWNEARLMMGLDDVRGLEEEVVLQWNDEKFALEPGVPENTVVKTGMSVPVTIHADTSIDFSLRMQVKGSGNLYFTPVGKTTALSLSSSWKNPAFDGQYLPVQHSTDESGFSANWKVLQVSRNFPQSWKETNYQIDQSAFGVRFIQPVDSYDKTLRCVKYAILFIALTFILFFFIEVLQKKQVHPFQYLLVGFALSVFYTLLLSVSEYTGFNTAYGIAALATVLLISIYSWSLLRSSKLALIFFLTLSGLYTYIFVLIQLQDYALLFGSIGLFVIIAVLMYYSRKIDWYNVQGKTS